MSWGWFSAFREQGAPTWYGDNRTPVVLDLQITALFSIFLIPSLAFLIILPGVKRTKAISAACFLSSMFTGSTLLVGLRYPCWQLAEVRIYSQYKAFSNDRMDALLGVKIGLETVNITLSTISLNNNQNPKFMNLNFNERFSFSEVHEMEQELTKALQKGLPYPILKVIEFMSVDRGSFIWGRQYRMAGYYTMWCHWMAIGCWLVAVIFLSLLPSLFAQTTVLVGVITLMGNGFYYWMTPQRLSIRFECEDGWDVLQFVWGHCFWASLLAGTLCIVGGGVLWFLQRKKLYILETVFSSRFYTPHLMSEPIYLNEKSNESIKSFDSQGFHSTASIRL